MGSVPIFHNPYGSNGSSPAQIDKIVGTAYEVVREVAENLEYIKHVSAHMQEVFLVSGSTDGIDFIFQYVEELSVLLDHIEEVLVVAANIDDINAVASDLTRLDIIADNMAGLADLYSHLDAIMAHGGVVTVADTAPVTEVNGKMWWESDTGNLYTWYDDGTSAQWVQINIAGQTYDWLDIINKPSAFPPTAHSHTEDVKKAGDTMTGNLLIAPPVGVAQLTLRKVGNSANQLVGQAVDSGGVASARWAVLLGNTLAETGGATGRTGSDFEIKRYTNVGGVIDSPFNIPRSTGIPNFINGLTAKTPSGTVNDTTVATTAYVKTQIASFADIVGNVLTLAAKPVIRVVKVGAFDTWSLAYGNGLAATKNAAGTAEGMYNVSMGFHSLLDLTTGNYNSAVGFQAGQKITTGQFNTAMGRAALVYLTTGSSNTGFGQAALAGNPNSIGNWLGNTAVGVNALYDIKDGANYNTGVGVGVLSHPGTSILAGSFNTAIGVSALQNTGSGSNNNAFGYLALGNITTGNNNIAIGWNSGTGITTGSGNIIIGHNLTGLAPGLANTLFLATGDGVKLLQGSAAAGVAVRGSVNAAAPIAGTIGEYLEVIVAPANDVPVVNVVSKVVCQLTLPAGDWDVYGWLGWTMGTGTALSMISGSLSLTASADFSTPGASNIERQIPAAAIGGALSPNFFKGPIGHRRMSISASDIVYLVAYSQYSGTAISAYGKIWARRAR